MLIEDLAEFLDEPLGRTQSDVEHGSYAIIDAAVDWQGDRESFYRSVNNCFLFDLVEFNTRPSYWGTRIAPLADLRDKNILDFGCGIGTIALYLTIGHNRICGYDINPRVLEFAEFRRERLGFSTLTFVNKLPDLSQFDIITAVDVLEHIVDLHSLILHLGQGMKSGARFYHFDNFTDTHPYPLHYDKPEDWDKWQREAGFSIQDERWALKN